jgi:hypothetical protein
MLFASQLKDLSADPANANRAAVDGSTSMVWGGSFRFDRLMVLQPGVPSA